MLHTFPFQISLIKWSWSMGLLSPSSLESWVCPLNTAWGLVHFCPLLLACPEHLHPPLTSAAVKPSPFLCLTFSQSFLIKELKRWIFFSDIYPVSWDVKKFPITFLSVEELGRLPECSTPGSPSNVSPVMWEMAQAQVILVHEKDLQKNSPPSEELWEFTGSLWRWTPFGHGNYALGIQIFKHGCQYSRKIL